MTDKKSAVDKMNEYKGSALPAPIIPIVGFSLGMGVPYGLVHGGIVTNTDSGGGGAVKSTLQSLGYVAFLFIAEFFLGAKARSTSTKASFSPAAAAATGNPFEIVRANRIHQNHIESFMILLPSALAAAASGVEATWIRACTISWVGFRFMYRIGYCYDDNPFWRIAGVAAAQTQSMICLYMWHKNGGSKL